MFEIFLTGALFNDIPGIIVQFIQIPVLVFALQRAGVTEQKQCARRSIMKSKCRKKYMPCICKSKERRDGNKIWI